MQSASRAPLRRYSAIFPSVVTFQGLFIFERGAGESSRPSLFAQLKTIAIHLNVHKVLQTALLAVFIGFPTKRRSVLIFEKRLALQRSLDAENEVPHSDNKARPFSVTSTHSYTPLWYEI